MWLTLNSWFLWINAWLVGSRHKKKTRQDALKVSSQIYCWQQDIQKKIRTVEDPYGSNAINTCFNQLIKQTESLHILKSHWTLISKLSHLEVQATSLLLQFHISVLQRVVYRFQKSSELLISRRTMVPGWNFLLPHFWEGASAALYFFFSLSSFFLFTLHILWVLVTLINFQPSMVTTVLAFIYLLSFLHYHCNLKLITYIWHLGHPNIFKCPDFICALILN